MSGRGESVEIIDASAAIFICVGKNHDMLVGYAGKGIVYASDIACGQIAVGIKCAEIGAYGCGFPLAETRHTHSAVGRRSRNGHKVEIIGPLTERLM